ncbi:acyl-CoA dehydrogenase [Dictyobacter alpinus]|uniref:Acyl-CoA dehydrogenase n=1 Tax=Dictyobacter alpinus TaxID=2014873 RepID=A0A402BJ67_9CHLR|nr:acyl-CoA dehydrogenase family protein [Dictyobacter alpinus]GCE31292.1 acyl-CoA dehydrogenase [Dictyobacter alpinus]
MVITAINEEQETERRSDYRAFVDQYIVPYADQYDRQASTPPELIQRLARQGYLGALIPTCYGGSGLDMVTLGILSEELGRGCSSIRSLLTVHSMVAYALLRWGKKWQQERWLPKLASGEMIGAFGLSEPNVGSDAKSIEATATIQGEEYVLNGRKKWTTYGQIATLFLIFAQCDGKVSAFLVERDTPGFSVEPLHGITGTRASMLGELFMHECRIPRENLIGGRGFGLASVGTSALDIGRYTVACGCVGLIQSCLEACLSYTNSRQQFGSYLKDFQLTQQMITRMMSDVRAARLLCQQAGQLKDSGDPTTIMETWIAKYFASTAAVRAANDAVQLHGANGCTEDYPVQRYLRDAKVMEIIEGSTQIQQISIAQYGYQQYSMTH